jgi:hypothetical protein
LGVFPWKLLYNDLWSWIRPTGRRLAHPGEDGPCADDSRQALGQTQAGRYLRVVYIPDEEGDGIFVVTAYLLAGKQLQAFPRRQRRRKR